MERLEMKFWISFPQKRDLNQLKSFCCLKYPPLPILVSIKMNPILLQAIIIWMCLKQT